MIITVGGIVTAVCSAFMVKIALEVWRERRPADSSSHPARKYNLWGDDAERQVMWWKKSWTARLWVECCLKNSGLQNAMRLAVLAAAALVLRSAALRDESGRLDLEPLRGETEETAKAGDAADEVSREGKARVQMELTSHGRPDPHSRQGGALVEEHMVDHASRSSAISLATCINGTLHLRGKNVVNTALVFPKECVELYGDPGSQVILENPLVFEGLPQIFRSSTGVVASVYSCSRDPGDDYRLLAALPPPPVAACAEATVLDNGNQVTMIQAVQLGVVYRLARRKLRSDSGLDMAQWRDPNPWSQEQESTHPTTTFEEGDTSKVGQRKMKFMSILDQGDREFLVAPESQKHLWLQTYVNLKAREDLTVESEQV
eukprot:s503_g27.t1